MRKTTLAAIAGMAVNLACGTPAEDREWSQRVTCEMQSAAKQSLPPLEFMQGTTPLLSLDQYRSGKAVDATNTVQAVFYIGPTSTNVYFVPVTNYAVSGNGYLCQMPTIGTNAVNWWYTALFLRNGYTYWTGNGRLTITPSTVTGDGLTWQTFSSESRYIPTNRTATIDGVVGGIGVSNCTWTTSGTSGGAYATWANSASNSLLATAVTGDQSNQLALAVVHTNRTDNPHAVTAAQVGALVPADTNGWTVGAHEAWVTSAGFFATNSISLWDANGYKAGFERDFIAAANSAIPGDSIIIGPGRYSVSPDFIITNNVKVVGAGQYATVLEIVGTEAGQGGGMRPGSDCTLQNLTIENYSPGGNAAYVIGRYFGPTDENPEDDYYVPNTNVTFVSCRLFGDYDGLAVSEADATIIDCQVLSKYDALTVVRNYTNTIIRAFNSIICGNSSGTNTPAHGVAIFSGNAYLSGCDVSSIGTNGPVANTNGFFRGEDYGIWVGTTGVLTAELCRVEGAATDIASFGQTVERGCVYNTSTGTITSANIIRGDGSIITANKLDRDGGTATNLSVAGVLSYMCQTGGVCATENATNNTYVLKGQTGTGFQMSADSFFAFGTTPKATGSHRLIVAGDVMPSSNGAGQLGNASLRWLGGYFGTSGVDVSGPITGGATTLATVSNLVYRIPRWIDEKISGDSMNPNPSASPTRVEVSGAGSGVYAVGWDIGDDGSFSLQMAHGLAETNSLFPNLYYGPHLHVSSTATAGGADKATFVLLWQIAALNGDYNGTLARTQTVTFAAANTHYLCDFGVVTNNALSGRDSVIARGTVYRIAGADDVGANVAIVDSIDYHIPVREYGSTAINGD